MAWKRKSGSSARAAGTLVVGTAGVGVAVGTKTGRKVLKGVAWDAPKAVLTGPKKLYTKAKNKITDVKNTAKLNKKISNFNKAQKLNSTLNIGDKSYKAKDLSIKSVNKATGKITLKPNVPQRLALPAPDPVKVAETTRQKNIARTGARTTEKLYQKRELAKQRSALDLENSIGSRGKGGPIKGKGIKVYERNIRAGVKGPQSNLLDNKKQSKINKIVMKGEKEYALKDAKLRNIYKSNQMKSVYNLRTEKALNETVQKTAKVVSGKVTKGLSRKVAVKTAGRILAKGAGTMVPGLGTALLAAEVVGFAVKSAKKKNK